MTTKSYPVVDQGMTGAMHRRVHSMGDGIVDDYAGNALGLTLATDTATVAPGFFRLNGQIMENSPATSFPLPAVTTSTVYQICLRFDPSKDALVAENGDPIGPLDLVSGVKGAITTPSGGGIYPLFDITRTPGQAMSAAVTPVSDWRRWAGEVALIQQPAPLPNLSLPRGSQVTVLQPTGTRRLWVRDMVGSTLSWVPASSPYAMAAGEGPIGRAVAPGGISTPLWQAFPSGRFTVPPIITFGGTDARLSVQWGNRTKDGFNLWVRNVSSSEAPPNTMVSWVATQQTYTSATG